MEEGHLKTVNMHEPRSTFLGAKAELCGTPSSLPTLEADRPDEW